MIGQDKKDILNAVSVPLILTDGDKIISANQQATKLFDLTNPDSQKTLWSLLYPIIPQKKDEIIDGATHIINLTNPHQKQKLKITINKIDDKLFLLTIRDITKEAQLLQEFLLLKKELDAQKTLKKKREDEIIKLQRNIDLILNAFSDDIAIIDNNLNIITINSSNQNNTSEKEKQKKCYELLGKTSQCNKCPLLYPTENISNKQIISHETQTGYITEEIRQSQDNNYIIIFKDTTKQIQLIKQIKEQQKTIERQKDIFMNLSMIMTEMQENTNIEQVITKFLNIMMQLIRAKSALLLVENYRKKGTLWLAIDIGMINEQVDFFIKTFMKCPLRHSQSLFIAKNTMPTTNYQWEIIQILLEKNHQIGILILEIIDKPKDYEEIITTYIEVLNTYLKNKILTMKLEERANIDGLTGLYNRSYYNLILEELKNNAIKYNTDFSIIILDLNGLKPINDNYGHEAGDQLIIAAANLIKNTCRSDDIPARIGGDEFYILLPNTTEEKAALIANRIKKISENEKILLEDKSVISISFSIGYAGSDKTSIEDMVQVADERMYADKAKYYENHPKIR